MSANHSLGVLDQVERIGGNEIDIALVRELHEQEVVHSKTWCTTSDK